MVTTRSTRSTTPNEDNTSHSRPVHRVSSNGALQGSNGTVKSPNDFFPPPKPPPIFHPINLPHAPKSLSGISLRSFALGLTLGACALLTAYLLLIVRPASPLWRAPFFLSTLSLFHFLEFWTTATYNTRYADTAAFLLTTNGNAYNVAHFAAFLEVLLANTLFRTAAYKRYVADPRVIAAGLVLIVLGQSVRSTAMAQAGTNFNHTVQVEKNKGHELVTRGIYRWLRHPSYFGFFWWSIGTQVALGNVVCAVVYAVVLQGFFRRRIRREEELLVGFFWEDYVEYRKRTPVGIPFT